ncbi:hypothetical protein [Olsenella intestinalis]|uniref:hypothetical protein n=1 Tax=Olsenella intestinalis TaxID=2930083 RepID=UPI00200BD51D|nr:hypothetical protein [Olsenella intestinalis]
MVLQLDEELVRHPFGNEDDGFWTTETIRFSPRSCKFVFYSDEDLDFAFNNAQRSIEAKFADRYRASAVVVPASPNMVLFDVQQGVEPKDADLWHEDIAQFEMLDRLKGALFGYYLGFHYSPPKADDVRDDYVVFFRTVDDMVNAVTQKDSEGLEGYRHTLEYILHRFVLNGMARGTKAAQKAETSKVSSFCLEDEIEKFRRLSSVELPMRLRDDTVGLSMYRSDLEDRIRAAMDAWKSPTRVGKNSKPSVEFIENIPAFRLPEGGSGLAECLINHLIQVDVLAGTKRSLGYSFALECGKMVRGYVGDRWESSGEREYVNRLLPHLNNMKEFDPNDNPGIEDEGSFETLRTLAQLCEKQDNRELDSFYRYLLVRCGVADLRVPFAMWGAAFGFSAMPKTLCDGMSEKAEDVARDCFDRVVAKIGQAEVG